MPVTLFDGPVYTWYSILENVAHWFDIKVALVDYIKPADYAYKMRQAVSVVQLAKWLLNQEPGWEQSSYEEVAMVVPCLLCCCVMPYCAG